MKKQAPKGFRRDTSDGMATHLLYEDELGRMMPLLDQTGRPVNFERKPKALQHAFDVMKRMDANAI